MSPSPLPGCSGVIAARGTRAAQSRSRRNRPGYRPTPPQPARSLAPGGERCKRPQLQRYQDHQHQEPAPAQGLEPWAQALRQLEKLVRLQSLLKVVRGDAEGRPTKAAGIPAPTAPGSLARFPRTNPPPFAVDHHEGRGPLPEDARRSTHSPLWARVPKRPSRSGEHNLRVLERAGSGSDRQTSENCGTSLRSVEHNHHPASTNHRLTPTSNAFVGSF